MVDESSLSVIDQQVDVIFVMTPKHLNARFRHARTVVVQYGMAKEYYNYGLWRTSADLNMMYGPYSTKMVEGHAVARSVGNLRLDGYTPSKTGGEGLLYLPTYGELSTLERFAGLLPQLNSAIPISIKLHHASEFANADVIERLKDNPRITLLDGYTDTLDHISGADIVLSDYSGAIFDAIFLDRPVALFQPGYTQSVKRTDDRSIEISCGSKLGEVLDSDDSLITFFDRLASEGYNLVNAHMNPSDFLSNKGKAVPAALELLEQLINDEVERTIVQESIGSTYAKLASRPTKPVVISFRTALRQRLDRWVSGQ